MNQLLDRPAAVESPASRGARTTVANESAMRRVLADLGRLASAPRAAVIFRGEAGSGRRHLARRLHEATFPDGAFISYDKSMSGAKLHELYAGPEARSAWLSGSGSSLFVHDFVELDASAQNQLLALCQKLSEGQHSLRLIASTSQDLARAVREGRVKSELVHCFPCVVDVPALRQRPHDLAPLLEHFARVLAERFACSRLDFTAAAVDRLATWAWPGNLTELSALVERLTLLSNQRTIDVADLPTSKEVKREPEFELPPEGIDLSKLERRMIEQALKLAGQNQTRAATLVGLTRDQLRYRMSKFGLATRD